MPNVAVQRRIDGKNAQAGNGSKGRQQMAEAAEGFSKYMSHEVCLPALVDKGIGP